MELAIIVMLLAALTWIVAKLLILLTPALFYSTMAFGGGVGALEFSAGPMTDTMVITICVQLVIVAWMLWKSFGAWRDAARALKLV